MREVEPPNGNGNKAAGTLRSSRRTDLLEPQPQTRIGDLCPECVEAAVVKRCGAGSVICGFRSVKYGRLKQKVIAGWWNFYSLLHLFENPDPNRSALRQGFWRIGKAAPFAYKAA
jgi:hypothetical protein